MHASEYHGDLATPEVSGNLVGSRRESRHAGDTDQIHIRVPRNVLDLFVDDLNVGVFGAFGRHGQQAQHRETKGLAAKESATSNVAPFAAGRCYQENLHRCVLPCFGKEMALGVMYSWVPPKNKREEHCRKGERSQLPRQFSSLSH